MRSPYEDAQWQAIARAAKQADLPLEELWMRYLTLGGNTGFLEVEAYLNGMLALPDLDADVLAHAANERLDEVARLHHAPYSRPVRGPGPARHPTSALVGLLRGAESAPAERLAALAEAAGQPLQVRIAVHLVDYEQRALHRLPARASDESSPLPVEHTPAGEAFRTVRVQAVADGADSRLWVPLVDGVERLGVLEVGCAEGALEDPDLRAHCRWISALLGHLVTILSQYGDALQTRRLSKARTAAEELVWSLLPPLTAATDSFVVSGLVEPAEAAGGDLFDYALSENTAHLAVFDAAGADPGSELVAATAVAAYRAARRAGHDLVGQAREVDEAITARFGGNAYATAVLTEVDLATGRLRYLNAGHPHPLLLRPGRVVTSLGDGGRPPLGRAGGGRVAAESLNPDDCLVLYTDGLVGARDAAGREFGVARLADFLRHAASAGYPPPEATRRLVHEVLAHRDGPLHDDVTVLLSRWTAAQVVDA
ncbi:PP2C family protein-serine/threonine phosphatase [Saccharothrix obliqua]|uniref:PP2C family protein-serine/threonine phosphatase n=1 Tax=Saccharothrix obliqua TaxID=2861747 RepID=UPI001C5F1CCE|nr:PP2C family protein-serine/threonine phosphatase [Saccharothrix obliqua]MBW4720473.1 serine/threonine-protein phosphatase [Saccharothrix obliqua]